MSTPTIVWSIVVAVVLVALVVLIVKWHRYGLLLKRRRIHRPESTDTSRALADEQLAKLREIGGNGQHKSKRA